MKKKNNWLRGILSLLAMGAVLIGCEDLNGDDPPPVEKVDPKVLAQAFEKKLNTDFSRNVAEIDENVGETIVTLIDDLKIGAAFGEDGVNIFRITIPENVTLKTGGSKIQVYGAAFTIDGAGTLYIENAGDITLGDTSNIETKTTLTIGRDLTVAFGSGFASTSAYANAVTLNNNSHLNFNALSIELPADLRFVLFPSALPGGKSMDKDKTLIINGELDRSSEKTFPPNSTIKMKELVIGKDGLFKLPNMTGGSIEVQYLTFKEGEVEDNTKQRGILPQSSSSIKFSSGGKIKGLDGIVQNVPAMYLDKTKTDAVSSAIARGDQMSWQFVESYSNQTALKSYASFNILKDTKEISGVSGVLMPIAPSNGGIKYEALTADSFIEITIADNKLSSDGSYLAWYLNRFRLKGSKLASSRDGIELVNSYMDGGITDEKNSVNEKHSEVTLEGKLIVDMDEYYLTEKNSDFDLYIPKYTTLRLTKDQPLIFQLGNGIAKNNTVTLVIRGGGRLALDGTDALQLTKINTAQANFSYTFTRQGNYFNGILEVNGDDGFKAENNTIKYDSTSSSDSADEMEIYLHIKGTVNMGSFVKKIRNLTSIPGNIISQKKWAVIMDKHDKTLVVDTAATIGSVILVEGNMQLNKMLTINSTRTGDTNDPTLGTPSFIWFRGGGFFFEKGSTTSVGFDLDATSSTAKIRNITINIENDSSAIPKKFSLDADGLNPTNSSGTMELLNPKDKNNNITGTGKKVAADVKVSVSGSFKVRPKAKLSEDITLTTNGILHFD